MPNSNFQVSIRPVLGLQFFCMLCCESSYVQLPCCIQKILPTVIQNCGSYTISPSSSTMTLSFGVECGAVWNTMLPVGLSIL